MNQLNSKNYVMNMETLKIELYFEKSEYDSLTENLKKELHSAFLWKRAKKAWVSRAKEPNLWRAKDIAKKLGFENEERIGERLTYAEQLERKAERAEARAERMEEYADNAVKRADALQKDFNKYRQDWSWLTQPIIAGHSGSQRFARQRQAVIDRYEKGLEEYRKSDYFREKAETSRQTATMAELENPVYLENRIKECNSQIRKITGTIANYENNLYDIENGKVLRRYNGDIVTANEVQERLKYWIEQMEVYIDKQGFFENCLEKIGGIKYSKENIKRGYIVNMRNWGRCEVIKANPKTVDIKTEHGSFLRESYGAVLEIITADEKKDNLLHPFKEGDILAHYSISGEWVISAYKVIGTTAKMVKLVQLSVENGKILENQVMGKEITKKPSFREFNKKWTVYHERWPLYKVN